MQHVNHCSRNANPSQKFTATCLAVADRKTASCTTAPSWNLPTDVIASACERPSGKELMFMSRSSASHFTRGAWKAEGGCAWYGLMGRSDDLWPMKSNSFRCTASMRIRSCSRLGNRIPSVMQPAVCVTSCSWLTLHWPACPHSLPWDKRERLREREGEREDRRKSEIERNITGNSKLTVLYYILFYIIFLKV